MLYLSDGQEQHGPYDAATVAAWAETCGSFEGWWVWDGAAWTGLGDWVAARAAGAAEAAAPLPPRPARPPNPLGAIHPRVLPHTLAGNNEGEAVLTPADVALEPIVLDEDEAGVVADLDGVASIEDVLRARASNTASGGSAGGSAATVHTALGRLFAARLLSFRDDDEKARFVAAIADGASTDAEPTASAWRRRIPLPGWKDGFSALPGTAFLERVLASRAGRAVSALAVLVVLVAFPLDPLIDPFAIEGSRVAALLFHVAVFTLLARIRWGLLAAGLAGQIVHPDRSRLAFSPFSVARAFPSAFFARVGRRERRAVLWTAFFFPFVVAAACVAALVLDLGFPWAYRLGWDALLFALLDLRPWGRSSGMLLAESTIRPGARRHARAFLRRGFLKRTLDFRAESFAGESRLVKLVIAAAGWFVLAFFLLDAVAFPAAGGLFSDLVEPRAAGPVPALLEAAASAWFLGGLLVALSVPLVLLGLHALRNLALLLPARKAKTDAQSPADHPLLAGHVFLQGIPDADRAAFRKAFATVLFEKRAVLVRQGDVADAFYILLEGEAAVVREHASGHAEIVNRLGPGDGFGEQGLLETGRRNATVRATSRGRAARLDAAAFARWREAAPGNAERLTAFLRALGVLRRNDAFRLLDPDALTWLVSRLEPIAVRAGQVVVIEGAAGTEMFLIAEGTFSVRQRGREVGTLESPAFFGEMALLNDRPRNATVTATTDGLLYRLDGADFRELMFASFGFRTETEQVAQKREVAS